MILVYYGSMSYYVTSVKANVTIDSIRLLIYSNSFDTVDVHPIVSKENSLAYKIKKKVQNFQKQEIELSVGT